MCVNIYNIYIFYYIEQGEMASIMAQDNKPI